MIKSRQYIVAGIASAVLTNCATPKAQHTPREPGSVVAKVTSGPYHTMASGAETRLRKLDSGEEIARSTNGCGVATFGPITAGMYSLRASLNGSERDVANVPVSDGTVSLVEVDLQPPANPAPGNSGAAHTACTPPEFLSGPSPSPPMVGGRPLSGCIVVDCVIDTGGTVTGCRAVEPLEGATQSVIRELQQRRYSPSLCEGKPADWNYTFRIDFGP